MTQKSKEQLEYTLSTHAIERLVPSKAAMRLCGQLSEGTLDANAAVTALLRQYGIKRVPANG